MTLDDSIEQWLDHLLLVKGRSTSTVVGYRSDLRALTRGITHLDDFTLNHVRAMLAGAQDLSPATRARRVSAAKNFMKFTAARGWSQGGSMHRLVGPKLPQKIAEHFEESETTQLLDGLKATALPDMIQARDWALFELIYGCGLRVEEAVSMDLNDLDPDAMKILVHGKGDKHRALPIGPNQLAPLVLWLMVRTPAHESETALFLGPRGGRLDQRAARRALTQACEATGVRPLSPHALRHSCATHMVDGGADIRFVGEFLGHESLATTEKYVHVAMKRLVSVYQSAHPRAGERTAA